MSKNSIVTNSSLLPVTQPSNFCTPPSYCPLSQPIFYNERKWKEARGLNFSHLNPFQQLEFPEATLLGGVIL